ncbi:MAG: carbohydrate ABC transporter substrate-binding protein [Tenericutes bacterium]|nr:carbohydrate ABC transporter substrate-binding protein [Mycoplasmatota bacterium]
MKKLLIVLVAFIAIFTLVGCGETTTVATTAAPTTTTAAPETLKIFQNKVEIDVPLSAYATAWGEANNVDVEVVTCGGDSCAYGTQILAEFQTADSPDIFVIEGMGGYNEYVDYVLDLSGEAWLTDTDLTFKVDGTPYGFPVAVEGWGMAYNAEILDAAGVDPADLTTQAAYETAFIAIEAYFLTTYGVDWADDYAVVSMAAASGMTWVTGLHNFNGYLSAGLAYDDSSVIDDLNAGVANATRLGAYADWVDLLFTYADPIILLEGTYDTQVGKFAAGEAAFIHQGNWIDPNLMAYFEAEVDPYDQFEMGYAPHAAAAGENDSIFVSAPSYYVINTESDSIAAAKLFLNDLASTTAGHEYMVNEAKMIPAFKSVTLVPSNPLSAAVAEWMSSGNIYAWWQNDMPSGFGMDTLGPIYTNFASDTLDKASFIAAITGAIEALAD